MTSVHEIKNRLLRVIDKDGSVLNLPEVMEIIVILENTKITKNELEETRLGKYINDVRRAAQDLPLQKRAKKLIKSWQLMIQSSTQVVKKSVSAQETSLKRIQSSPAFSSSLKNNKRSNLNNNVNGSSQVTKISSKKQPVNTQGDTKIKEILKTKSVFQKSKSAQNLKDTGPSFVCKQVDSNGIKLSLTTSSSQPRVSPSLVSSESERLKRKRKERSDPSKLHSFNRTSNELSKSSSTNTSTKKEDHVDFVLHKHNNTFNYDDRDRTSTFTKSSSLKTIKHSSSPSSMPLQSESMSTRPTLVGDGEISNGILPLVISRNLGEENAGVDGCRTNDGLWHSWSDSFVLKQKLIDKKVDVNDESDLLIILPYVELD